MSFSVRLRRLPPRSRQSSKSFDEFERSRPAPLELLQRPSRRRALLRRLPRAADLPALPEDGGRADEAAVRPAGLRPRGSRLADPARPRRRRARGPLPPRLDGPRALIDAIVEVMRPEPGMTICDPACGTGGFLLAAHEYISSNYPYLDRDEKRHLRFEALRGTEIVDNAARLCVMNLLLHGIGAE